MKTEDAAIYIVEKCFNDEVIRIATHVTFTRFVKH